MLLESSVSYVCLSTVIFCVIFFATSIMDIIISNSYTHSGGIFLHGDRNLFSLPH